MTQEMIELQEMFKVLILSYSAFVFVIGFTVAVVATAIWHWKDVYRNYKRAKEKSVKWEWIKNDEDFNEE